MRQLIAARFVSRLPSLPRRKVSDKPADRRMRRRGHLHDCEHRHVRSVQYARAKPHPGYRQHLQWHRNGTRRTSGRLHLRPLRLEALLHQYVSPSFLAPPNDSAQFNSPSSSSPSSSPSPSSPTTPQAKLAPHSPSSRESTTSAPSLSSSRSGAPCSAFPTGSISMYPGGTGAFGDALPARRWGWERLCLWRSRWRRSRCWRRVC